MSWGLRRKRKLSALLKPFKKKVIKKVGLTKHELKSM